MFISNWTLENIFDRLELLEKKVKSDRGVLDFVLEQGRESIVRRLDVLTNYLRDPCGAPKPTFVKNVAEAYEAHEQLRDIISRHHWGMSYQARWDLSGNGEDEDNG